MSKFKVFKFNKSILVQLGFFSNRFSADPDDAFFKSAQTYYMILIKVTFISSMILFVCKNLAEFNDTLRTCSIIFETLQAWGMYMSFGLNTSVIRTVYLKLQTLVDKSTEGKDFKIHFFPLSNKITLTKFPPPTG